MMTITERAFLKAQIVDLNRLIDLTGDDPLMTPGLVARKAEFERQISEQESAGPAQEPGIAE